jgi:hypothetical protein
VDPKVDIQRLAFARRVQPGFQADRSRERRAAEM